MNTQTDGQNGPGRRKRKGRLSLVAATLGLLLAMTTLVVAPSPASAASCWKITCHGQAAIQTGCSNDARAIAHARIPGYQYQYIYLMWSPTCETSWAKMDKSIARGRPSGLSVRNMWGWRRSGIREEAGFYALTSMVYNPTWGCARASWVGPPGSAGTSCV